MTVSLCPEASIVELEVRVSKNGHVGPMMESVVEGLRASSPHENLATFTTLLRNGSDPAKVSEGNEVSEPNGVMSVSENGGEDEGTDTVSLRQACLTFRGRVCYLQLPRERCS